MDVFETKNIPNNYIEMVDSDFYKLVSKYNLQKFIDEDLNRYTLYNGFTIKLVPYVDF